MPIKVKNLKILQKSEFLPYFACKKSTKFAKRENITFKLMFSVKSILKYFLSFLIFVAHFERKVAKLSVIFSKFVICGEHQHHYCLSCEILFLKMYIYIHTSHFYTKMQTFSNEGIFYKSTFIFTMIKQ